MSAFDIFVALLKYCSPPVVFMFLGIWLALHYQEKIQKWSVVFWKFIRIFWKKAERKIISNDIEGRVNEFTKSLEKEMTNFQPIGVQIQWVEESESPSAFFSDDKLIIRMRGHRDQNKNFVYASMVFISKAILTKAKKYISKTQKESVDLFIGKKLFEKEKPQVIDRFFEDFFSPRMESGKIAELIEKYNIIDKAGLFFPLLVQELTFLGEKVFWHRRDDRIIAEVTNFISFLEDYANREIGEVELPQNFEGIYSRCGIMIVARAYKRELGNISPYTDYINGLIEKRIDTVYIIGPAFETNVKFIDQIVGQVEQEGSLKKYAEPRRYKAKIMINGKRQAINSYLLVLRNPDAVRYFDEEYQKEFIEPSLNE